VDPDTWGLYSGGGGRWTIPDMETSLHSHIAAIHIQDRIDRAAGERLAREARAASKPEPRRARRLWWARPRAKVAAMRGA
jgi:hypothetical protein